MPTMMLKAKPTGRRSPFTRVADPALLVLQPRDEAIIEAVYHYGLLTGEQVQKLVGFGCAPRRNVRLRALFDHGYLDRKFLPTIRGSAKVVYVLGPKGVFIAAQKLGLDPVEVKRRRKAALAMKPLFLEHALQVNDIRLVFTLAMEGHPAMKLDRWKHTPELSEVRLIPDGYCRYWYREQLWSFFLELDRSTESHRRFKAKVETYLNFGLSGHYQRHFGLKFFRVLVVTLTPERLLNLKRLVAGITEKIFWFATLKDLTPETVFGRVWKRPNTEGLFALHEEEKDALLSSL